MRFAMPLCLLLLFMSLGWAQPGGRVRVLRVGTFHGHEVREDEGGSWLALSREGDAVRAVPVRLRMDAVDDPVLDGPDEKTGRRVRTEPELEDVPLLLRGLDDLPPGPVPTAGLDLVLPQGRPQTIVHGQKTYALTVACRERAAVEGQRQYDCPLVLSAGGQEQELFVYSAYRDHAQVIFSAGREPRVLWAGDLDGDGQLDLLLNSSDHENVEEVSLFLSRQAEPGRLVRLEASFCSVGC